ncbi:hypothetical protein QSV08_12550 [Maribacter sp. BPC-D8]|uniref:hypothetical protein n=1 Tax=Maribacter sp. BPC-D8 TaxID=3053613 RepID=UPI002B485548|nr:hypothetical protein [Maribacter sp. BPC-D8]WRI28055.1 hypothetical protein QSV08_12550 [Maribacter sp. BPC-D8]
MKNYLQLILLFTLCITFGCKEDAKDQNMGNNQNQVAPENTIKEVDSVKKSTTVPTQTTKKYKFIIAESGLNYRDKPKGKVVGKFEWRDKVEYLFSTQQTETITDNSQEVEGTWVALKHLKDTVYVFDYYLSDHEPRRSRTKLYYAEAYYRDILQPSKEIDIRLAFVNVSESFHMPENFIDKKDLRKDTIHFSQKQRTEFFKRMNYANSDTLFIYDLASTLVKRLPIKNIPLMACVSIYSSVKDEYKTEDYYSHDYQIGFNLGKAGYSGFAVIGKENPFVEKGLQPLIFKKMNQQQIDSNLKKQIISEDLVNDSVFKPYTSNYKNISAFVKANTDYSNWSDLIIINTQTKESFDIYQEEGESSGKADLSLADVASEYPENYQYIGNLFKNKPPVVFGFMWESFGCSQIQFLDNNELPIRILCDNRH